MAFIGMRHVVAATIATETPGAALTYDAGMVVGKAIQGNLTWDRNDNPLYADDAIAENDNGATGGSIELVTDDLLDVVRAYLLGDEAISVGTGTSATTEYESTDEPAPYVGFGYMRVRVKNGVTSYQAVWYHKAQFGETNENAQTKGQTIEWQTPTINGRIMAVRIDETLKNMYRRRATFDTLAAAVAWVNGKANIGTTTQETPTQGTP